MTTPQTNLASVWAADPDERQDLLDGHSIDELSAYLDSGREPRNEHIEASAGCQIALESLEDIHAVSPDLLQSDAARDDDAGLRSRWMAELLGAIAMDAKAGRRLPITGDDGADLGITEGAIRGIVRRSERAVPGSLIGRVVLVGDVEVPDAEVGLVIDVAMPFGTHIPSAAATLRADAARRVRLHAELAVGDVDVVVHDVRDLGRARSARRPEGTP